VKPAQGPSKALVEISEETNKSAPVTPQGTMEE
jgi:hypothetical protein